MTKAFDMTVGTVPGLSTTGNHAGDFIASAATPLASPATPVEFIETPIKSFGRPQEPEVLPKAIIEPEVEAADQAAPEISPVDEAKMVESPQPPEPVVSPVGTGSPGQKPASSPDPDMNGGWKKAVFVLAIILLLAVGFLVKRGYDRQIAQEADALKTAKQETEQRLNAEISELRATGKLQRLTVSPGPSDVRDMLVRGVLTVENAANLRNGLTVRGDISASGNLTVTGIISAANLSGNGAGVVNVDALTLQGQPGSFYTNATNISSGTLGDSRLSTNVALLNSTQTFTGVNAFSQGLSLQGNLAGTTGAFSGNVSGANAINVNEFVTLGQLTTVSAGNYFIQDGNSYGATATLGTNDNFNLNLETNGTTKLTVTTAGNVGIGDTTPAALLTVGNGDLFQVNSSGALAAVTGITASGGYTQSGAAANTFSGASSFTAAGTALSVTNNANIGGTLNVTGNTTLTGDLAVNGGDITSAAALNITPGGALTVGATGQTLTLQGSATSITSTGAGNDITLSSADQIILNSTGTIELQDNTNITGTINGQTITSAANFTGTLAVTTLGSASTDTVLCRNGSNQLAACNSTFATTANAFLQNGNSFGTAASLGTNDNFDLNLETNGTTKLTVTTAGSVGIGTTSPAQKLDIAGGSLRLDSTSFASQTGVIYKDATRFLHDFNYGNNGTVTTIGQNTFLGLNSGNFTMGSTATQTFDASYNTGVGRNTLQNNTTGYQNSALGVNTLQNNTTGYNNSALGVNALAANTTGFQNSALGYLAGRYIADGTTANQTSNNSLYLGASTKASANGNANEIVIGYNTTGNGSNSVTLGNTSVTKTVLQGSVGIGTATPAQKLDITGGSLRLDSTSFASQTGIIYKGTVRFLHNFNYGNNGTVTTDGGNTFLGLNSGNFTMGSTATQVYQASYNTAIGQDTFQANTTGYYNSALGTGALYSNTTGYENSALGVSAGRFIADGSSPNQTSNTSLYLGRSTKASANGNSNEIVIGYNTIGNGSNSVTLGNTSVTKTVLQGSVGIGTATPAQKLDIAGGSLRLDNTSFASQTGIIYKDATRFLHNFNYGNNGTVTTDGFNTFLGQNAGNFTMGSTATAAPQASYNTGVGANNLFSNTTGKENSALGFNALFANTTGDRNAALGTTALNNNTTGYHNSAIGYNALYNNTTGYLNSALGADAGRFIADGSTANQTSNTSLYLGNNTKSSANGNSNEIVIGYNTIGNGSNSVTLGNTSVTKTVLQGSVGIGTTAPAQKLDIAGGSLRLDNTSFASQTGIIYKDATRFLHNFNYGNNGTVTTDGYNTFLGLNSGNFTMGSTATQAWHASLNTGVGENTLQANTTGYDNAVVGALALQNNTAGYYNSALGRGALQNNTTGYQNSALGRSALSSNNTGYNNSALGNDAGRFIADGTTANQTSNTSLYLGASTKSSANGNSNEIVIGYNAIGNGSNSVTLGNTSVTKTVLQGSVGIGTAAPAQKLDITGGSLRLDSTSFASQTGIIYKDATRFLHNFNYGNNGTVTTDGQNTFLGLNAGNFTMGSTATQVYQASYNTGVGYNSFLSNTTGYQNSALGVAALQNNTTGLQNSALGLNSLFSNTTGYENSALGVSSLYNNTTGYRNAALGRDAGRYIADGVTANQTSNTSLYLGNNTKASANGNSNEIVIGYNTIGNGSNSVTLGNTNITKTILQGSVGIGTTTPGYKLEVAGTNATDIIRITPGTGTISDSGYLSVNARARFGYDGTNVIISDQGTNKAIVFQSGGNNAMAITIAGNVGIGTTAPSQKLQVTNGNLRFDQVAAPTAPTVAVNVTAGNLNGAYQYRVSYVTALGETETGPASSVVNPANQQVNLSAISTSSDTSVTARKIYRTTAGGSNLTMKLVTTLNDNTTTTYTDNIADGSLGVSESRVNSTGGLIFNGTTRSGIIDNATTAIGINALRVNTGHSNTAMGISSLNSNTTGQNNSAMGYQSLFNVTTGGNNTGVGSSALFSNTTAGGNTAIGAFALYNNTTGFQSIAVGYNAGRFITDGTTTNQTSGSGVYLGFDTRASANGNSNEIVIGHTAIGNGSNSVTLGNTSITKTILQGSVGIGETAPGAKLQINTGAAGTIGQIIKAAASQTADLLQAQDSTGAILAKITSVGNLEVKNATITGTLTINGHVITANTTGTTTIAAGAAACTTPTVSVSGNDTAGTITITTGTGCAGTGVLGTVTFAGAYGAAPRVVVSADNASAAGLNVYTGSRATTTFTLDTATTPANSTTYTFNYWVAQ